MGKIVNIMEQRFVRMAKQGQTWMGFQGQITTTRKITAVNVEKDKKVSKNLKHVMHDLINL